MPPAIRVHHLSKRYRIAGDSARADYRTLREDLMRLVKKPRQWLGGEQNGSRFQDFWALRDIDFEVQPGEVAGIVGRNGAGKSTLLKILSRVTPPTSGTAIIRGHVGSLLEVGTGFHPELTGRENVQLNGAILGMSRQAIRARFDQIVAFSGLSAFIDTPVKRYSSGMYMKLAFAVAVQLQTEVLLIDEVLAVGDAAFQKQCLGRMSDIATEGRTILFVSHNLAAVRSLCKHSIWIDGGRIAGSGETPEVLKAYLDSGERLKNERTWDDVATAPGNDRVRLRRVRVTPGEGDPGDAITIDTPITVELECWNLMPGARLSLNLVLYNQENVCIFNSIAPPADLPAGRFRGYCRIPANLLNDSTYSIRLLVVKDESQPILDLESVAMFEVHEVDRPIRWYGKLIGAVRPQLDWRVEAVPEQNVTSG